MLWFTKWKKGIYKQVQGKQLPIHVPTTCNTDQLRQSALRKHVQFGHVKADVNHLLLYPDGSVVRLLPGMNEEFTLVHYKEEIGKQYSWLQLFLCPKDQFHGSFYG